MSSADRFLCVAVLCLAACCCLLGLSRAAVISIDFGGEWMKVALVKPGVPMEIVLNKESKRKTAAVISLRNGERLFGSPALTTAVKYPKNAYRYLQLLVGQKYDSPLVQKYREWFPFYDLKKDEERGTVLFQHDADTVFSPEELIGMLFNHSRQFVENYAEQPIRDVVITVPPFFSQAQRRSIFDIANLVGLNVLQLMGDNAAAALNYGLFRQASFNTTSQHIMFYDMGATSTTVTIVEYRKVQVKEGGIANMHPQLTVKGVGYDQLLGGLEMDMRLRDYLAKAFAAQKKTEGSVYDSPRAMAKLLKEAQRVKQVLSANSEHFAQIEGLLEDVDFRSKVTRVDFEEMCSDLFDRVQKPVQHALEAADMTMDEIDSVTLVGGGTRVPKVQEVLLKAVDRSELGKSLNTDEAAALGAVYQGAGRTKLFRVKKFIVKEGVVYPIQVSFSRVSRNESEDSEEVVRTVKRTLFGRGNAYPQKKVLTFNRYSDDFAFQVFYGALDFLTEEEQRHVGRLNISEVYLAGVSDALSQNKDGDTKGIKAHFRMDESGILNLDYAESIFEYPEDVQPGQESTLSKIGSTLSSFFGMGKSSDEEGTVEEETPSEQPTGEEMPTDQPTEEQAPSDQATEEKDSPEDGMDSESSEDTTDTQTPNSEQAVESEEELNQSSEQSEPTDAETEAASEEDETSGTESEEPVEANSEEEQEEISDGDQESNQDDVPESNGEGEEIVPDEKVTESEQEKTDSEDTPETVNATNATESETESDQEPKKKKKKKSKEKQEAPKGNLVKVNLTAEINVLDLKPMSDAYKQASVDKLQALQQHDDEKRENEVAKNNLESHVFETQDAMYSDPIIAVSTEEQREVILTALGEATDWLDDEGYTADTKTYKSKLRELKRASRALFKRVAEAVKRPKQLAQLKSSLNVSHDFLFKMKNLTADVQIFTEVEMTTLETLINETEDWLSRMEAEQASIPPHEEPVLLTYEIEEQNKRLDREIMYLLNKLRTHPPPRAKTANATNSTNSPIKSSTKNNSTKAENETVTENEELPTSKIPTTEEEEEQQETLELPGAEDSATPVTESEATEPATSEGEAMESPETTSSSLSDDKEDQEHQEL